MRVHLFLLFGLLSQSMQELNAEGDISAYEGVDDPSPSCDNVQSNLVPTGFFIFQASPKDSFSDGEVAIILAKFPDSSCGVPQPGDIGDGLSCNPSIDLGISLKSGGKNVSSIRVQASPSAARVESDYGVSFSVQPELYTAQDGIYLTPWVFILRVGPGMNTAKLDVNSIYIPVSCNSPLIKFNNTNYTLPSDSLSPKDVSIDTRPPSIVSVYTSEKAGNYTAGHTFEIVMKFSKDVLLSELPGQYSQVYLDAQASSKMLYGVPYIELNSKTLVALRGYKNPTDQSKLAFLYLVGTGEETPAGQQLDVMDGTTIQLNGGTITGSRNGLEADLTTMPRYGTIGMLSQ